MSDFFVVLLMPEDEATMDPAVLIVHHPFAAFVNFKASYDRHVRELIEADPDHFDLNQVHDRLEAEGWICDSNIYPEKLFY